MTAALFATESEAPTPEVRLTERDMLDLLLARHSAEAMGARRWVVAEHVHEMPGAVGGHRIADFMAIDCYSAPGTWRGVKGGRYEVHGFEVKVSRSDWLTELRDPSKAAAFMPYCHYWWLVAASRDVFRDDGIPDGWGVLVSARRGLRVAHRAPFRDAEPMPPAMVASFGRAVAKTAAREATS